MLTALLLLGCRPGPPTDVALEPKPTTSADALSVEPPPPLGEHRLYRWSVDGVVQPDLTERVVPAERTQRGQRWVVEVTRVVGTRRSAPRRRATRIGNGAPHLEATIVSTPQGLLAVPFAEDPDGDAVTVTARWRLDGVVRSEVLSVGQGLLAEGQVWTITLEASDGELTSEPLVLEHVVDTVAGPLDAAVIEPVPLTTLDTATLTLWPAGDPADHEVQWFVDGVLTATGPTLPPLTAHRDQAVYAVVQPLDPLGGPSVTTPAVRVANSAPAARGAALAPLPISASLPVTCGLEGFADPDGDPPDARVQWYVDEALVHEGPVLHPSAFARDDAIRCRAYPTDGLAEGEPHWSTTEVVVNSAPTLATLALSPEAPVSGDEVIAVPVGAFDIDGDEVAVDIEWYVDGMFAAAGPALPGPVVRGQLLEAIAVPSDGLDEGIEVFALPTPVVNGGPVVVDPAYVPAEPSAGEAVAVRYDLIDPEGDPVVAVEVGWFLDGTLAHVGPELPAGLTAAGDTLEAWIQADDGLSPGPVATLPAVVVAP